MSISITTSASGIQIVEAGQPTIALLFNNHSIIEDYSESFFHVTLNMTVNGERFVYKKVDVRDVTINEATFSGNTAAFVKVMKAAFAPQLDTRDKEILKSIPAGGGGSVDLSNYYSKTETVALLTNLTQP